MDNYFLCFHHVTVHGQDDILTARDTKHPRAFKVVHGLGVMAIASRKSAARGNRPCHLQVFDGGAIDEPEGGGVLRCTCIGFAEGDCMALAVESASETVGRRTYNVAHLGDVVGKAHFHAAVAVATVDGSAELAPLGSRANVSDVSGCHRRVAHGLTTGSEECHEQQNE